MTDKRRKPPATKPKKKASSAATPEAKPSARDTRRHRRPEKAPALVLVVDDFKDGRDLVVETLEFAGFRAAEAGDGIEALAKCRALRPHVALMDLSLPGLDGWEVTRQLKADPTTREIRIIALTAHAQSDALDRARRAGADDVLTKPCLPSEVVERVRELLEVGPAGPGAREEA